MLRLNCSRDTSSSWWAESTMSVTRILLHVAMDVLFVGTGAAELLTTFWENYNNPVG